LLYAENVKLSNDGRHSFMPDFSVQKYKKVCVKQSIDGFSNCYGLFFLKEIFLHSSSFSINMVICYLFFIFLADQLE